MKYHRLALFLVFFAFGYWPYSGKLQAQPAGNKPVPESEFYFLEVSGADSAKIIDYFNFCSYSNPLGKIFIPSLGPSLFRIDLGFWFIHLPGDGNKIELKRDEYFLYVNGKVRCIKPGNDYTFTNWIRNAKKEDLDRLDVICFENEESGEIIKPYLRKILDLKPDVSVIFNNDDINPELLALTSPRVLTLDKKVPPGLEVSNVEWLIIGDDSLSYKIPKFKNLVARLSNLKYVISIERDWFEVIYFEKCRNIKSLTLLEGASENADFLINYPKIEKLMISNGPAIKNHVKDLPGLKWLITSVDASANYNQLDHLHGLSALSIMGDYLLSRRDYSDITLHNPELRYIDLSGLNKVTALSPLSALPNLEGIILKDIDATTEDISQLKNLKYVGLDELNFDDKITAQHKIRTIKTFCPSCLVNEVGLCLGMGWILLLFPLLFIIVFSLRKWAHQTPVIILVLVFCSGLWNYARAQNETAANATESEFYFLEVSSPDNEVGLLSYQGLRYFFQQNHGGKILIPATGTTLFASFTGDVDNPHFFVQTPEDDRKIQIKNNEQFCYVDGKLRSVVASANPIFLSWLSTFRKEDVQFLDFVVFNKDFPASAEPNILRLIEYCPEVSFFFNEDSLILPQGLNVNRKPKVIFLTKGQKLPDDMDLSGVELLFVEEPTSVLLQEDPNLTDKFMRMPSLKYLSCSGEDIKYFSKMRKIRHLLTSVPKNLKNIDFLKNYPELTTLTLDKGTAGNLDLSVLNALPKIKWVNLNLDSFFVVENFHFLHNLTALGLYIENTAVLSRKNLQDLVADNPDLRCLSVIGNGMPPLLSPIVNLRDLESLNIENADGNLEYLSQLPKLKHVGIRDIDFADEPEEAKIIIKKVKAYCSNCLVNDAGMCLGSGWILLLLPLLFLITFLPKKNFIG